jgi:hypothetical protein
VFGRSTDVATICGVFAPYLLVIWFDVELNCAANQSKWYSVVIKRAMVVSIGRYLASNSGLME